MQPVRRIDQLFTDYSAAHAARANVVCHALGIPALFIGAIGLIERFSGTLALGIALVLLVVWLSFDATLGAIVLILSPFALEFAWVAPTSAVVAVFAAGVVVPVAGHILFEKGGPKSIRDGALGTLVAPLWLVARLIRRRA